MNDRLRFGDFELCPAERRVLVGGVPAPLGARAFDVLMALVERRGRVVGKDEILAAAWPGMVVEENNLAVQISSLRKLLGPSHIATVAGRGYQFTGLVDVAERPSQPSSAAPATAGTGLVGRADELRELDALVRRHRLVTLVGAGGIGKTSLADAWRARQPAGSVAWLELATVPDAASLPDALRTALSIPPKADLRAALAAAEGTLVLDNAEPLAAALAPLVRRWSADAPRLRILVTSQVPLRLQTEQVYRLGALQLPQPGAPPALAMESAALTLFGERVRAVDPSFRLTAANSDVAAEICRRLDGLPLAIELAAARVPALGLAALAAALDERFGALGHNRAAPARQRTLRTALEWTHGLLDPVAQAVFRELGDLNGVFTLADAQRVCAAIDPPIAGWPVLDALDRMVDGSLVNVEPSAGDAPRRYWLTESTRLFALELRHGPVRAPSTAPDNATARRLVGRLASDGTAGVAHDTVMALARRFGADDVRNLDGALKELSRAVDIASRVVAGADAGSATDAFVGEVLAAVAAQTKAGDFDAGTDAVDEALAELAQREAEQRALLHRSRLTLLEAGLEQDLLRRDAFAVARRLDALSALDGAERPAWDRAFRDREAAYFRAGVEHGDLLSLAVATEMTRRRLASAATVDERRDARIALARALAAQGDGDRGQAALEEAIASCRDALAECERHRTPQDWATLQHELSAALCMLGMRDGDASLLEESLHCASEALKERTRDRWPREWAASRHQLGSTLRCLAARESGSARLSASVRALRDALKEYTRARTPLEWARTQNVLGIALSIWARREGSMERHREAVTALREALQEITRERAPQEWARLQNNLGIELSAIGEVTGDVATLRASEAAYRSALLVYGRDEQPHSWALVHHNLGGLLRLIGERERDVGLLREAVRALQSSLLEHTRERFPLYWAAGMNDLGLALRCLGEREDGDASLQESVDALREALSERTRASVPLDWAGTQGDLAESLLALGERRGDASVIAEALDAAQAALQVATFRAAANLHASLSATVARAQAVLRRSNGA